MNQKYLITDPRPLECFKDKTFSDFKKLDVYKALYSSIETGKVENACHWITECIISGYCIEIMEKLILFGAKITTGLPIDLLIACILAIKIHKSPIPGDLIMIFTV